jgi:hypothetical protein
MFAALHQSVVSRPRIRSTTETKDDDEPAIRAISDRQVDGPAAVPVAASGPWRLR